MRFTLPVTLLLLGGAAMPCIASVVDRSATSYSDVAHNLHKRAAEHSGALARNIRRVFSNSTSTVHSRATTKKKRKSTCKVKSGTNSQTPKDTPLNPTANAAAKPSSGGSSQWKIVQNYQGQSFFQGWSFFTTADPTNGIVDYVDYNTAEKRNLIEINNAGNAIMRVETTKKVNRNRTSVRISTNYKFTGALILMDAVHMPVGCGTWPAFWTNGPNWPDSGEIDILEGVHEDAHNQATIHTNAHCTIPMSGLGITGRRTGETNCESKNGKNTGCGAQINDPASYGAGFNRNGGGVYAMLWDEDAIAVWFFPRHGIPSDINSGAPNPSAWDAPFARWPGNDCPISEHFYDHQAIFDTTLCGEWAGNAWGSCAQQTGVDTCNKYVRENGDKLKEAYWEVSYMKIFQSK